MASSGSDQTAEARGVVAFWRIDRLDPDEGPGSLVFNWRSVFILSGSALVDLDIVGSADMLSEFTPDTDGSYFVRLDVPDEEASGFDQAAITASTFGVPASAPEELLGRAKRLHVNHDWADVEDASSYTGFRRLVSEVDFFFEAATKSAYSAFENDLPEGTLSCEYFVVSEDDFGLSRAPPSFW